MSNAKQKTVLFTGTALPPEHHDRLTRRGYKLKIERSDLSETELIEALQGVSAYILGGVEKANRKVIEASPDLKVISFFGVGYESYIDLKAATDNGIAVTNTPGANSRSVAEFTIALMLDAVKGTTHLIEAAKRGEWKEERSWNISGKTLGIIGMGNIGAHVARIAHNGFDMSILYTSRKPKPQIESSLQAKFVALPELLKSCDVLSLHAATNADTTGMIGSEQLAMMKPSSVLINCSRAELVDAKALKEALIGGKLRAAAFDGYYTEPVPKAEDDEHGLVGLPHYKFLVSPHTAYFTEDATRAMADMSTASILEIMEGRSPTNLVNPDYERHIKAHSN